MDMQLELGTDTFAAAPFQEEIANCTTHGIGLALSIFAAPVLIVAAVHGGDVWCVVASAIYTASLVAAYAASTLSHLFQRPRLRRLFRMLDQGFIYFLIAGTYTPFALGYLRTGWWWLFGAIWGMGLVGFLSKTIWAHRVDTASSWVYLLQGWLPGIAAPILIGTVPATGLWCVLIGGLFYTFGTIFWRLDERIPFFHAAWHLCVIAGSAFHYFAILFYVV